jgi:integrase
MLRKWIDLDQRFQRLRQIPVHRQLAAMKLCSFAYQAERPSWERTIQHLQGRQVDLRDVLSVLGMEVRRRMVRAVHVDHDSVERGQTRHNAIVDGAPAPALLRRGSRPGRGKLVAHASARFMGAAVGQADRLEDIMSERELVDITGRLRSPAATPGHGTGCAPPNKGQRYPADPPTVEEIILVMRQAGPGPHADRTRGLIAILWRAGLRISEALALTESDLDAKTGSVLVRSGKGGKRRMVGMDDWAWEHVARWEEHRVQLPIGPLFCILAGPTRGRGWSATAARGELRRLAAEAGIRRRFAPHQLRHAHAIEMSGTQL